VGNMDKVTGEEEVQGGPRQAQREFPWLISLMHPGHMLCATWDPQVHSDSNVLSACSSPLTQG
jgi:hypothetical protein